MYMLTKQEWKTSLYNLTSNNKKHIQTAPLKLVILTQIFSCVCTSVQNKLNLLVPVRTKNLHKTTDELAAVNEVSSNK